MDLFRFKDKYGKSIMVFQYQGQIGFSDLKINEQGHSIPTRSHMPPAKTRFSLRI